MTAPETPTSGAAPAWEVRPRVVCLCGSTRFVAEYEIANAEETLAGRIVLSSGVFAPDLSDETKAMLDELHKRKIDIADEILVINPGGYIGTSTRGEIEYATAHGKPVRYLVEAGTEDVVGWEQLKSELPGGAS